MRCEAGQETDLATCDGPAFALTGFGGSSACFNEDKTKAITFTGELYNRSELTAELRGQGHGLQSDSDAELALHAFEQWGHDVGNKLRGVFAFGIYDTQSRTVFLIRDRIGNKPLFFTQLRKGTAQETFVFASEVKSLLADPAFTRTLDMQALSHYLTFQYVPHPWSIFEQAHKVAPGHWLTWRDGEIRTQRYWELSYEPKTALSEEEAVEQSMAHVDEALRVRLEPNTPMGVFLSGGVDSSSMVALMRQHIPGELRTFSIGFREQKFNELPYARQVAEKFETRHEEFIVQPDALSLLGELAWQYDEPMADSSAIPTFYVTQMAKQHVDVGFLGDGGDESFCGYERYRGFRVFNRYGLIPRPVRSIANRPFGLAARIFPQSAKLELLAYVNRASLMEQEHLYTQTMVIFRDYQKRALLAPEHRHLLEGPAGDSEQLTLALLNKHSDWALADRKPYSDIMSYLPGALIPKVERAAVANAFTARAPMLDHKVMEFCAHLPVQLKLKNGTLKYLLKKGVSRWFTDEFLNRPKQGFGVPVGDWFRGELRGFAQEFLMGERARARGYFDMAYVKRVFDQHVEGRQNQSHRLWTLLIFEAWCRTFLDRATPLSEGPITLR